MRGHKLLFAGSCLALATSQVAFGQAQTEDHAYDALGRLVITDTSGNNDGQARSYCYDKAGNRTDLRASTDSSAASCASTSPTPLPSPTPTPTPTPPPPPGNTPPAADNDFVSGDCMETATVNLTANDFDAEDEPVKPVLLSIVKTSGRGSASKVSASSVSVSFALSGGSGVFTYTIEDSGGATDTGTLYVTTNECPLE